MTIPTSEAQQSQARASAKFQSDLIALIPKLRAFSRGLCGRRAIAEDMTQEALTKAWRARDRFEPGTNLKAWVFTILRNEYFSHSRHAWRESHWDAEQGERIPGVRDEQDWAMEFSDMARAVRDLTDGQREALILVAAGGFSYRDAAGICGVAVGTMKSRVARARTELMNLLDGSKALGARTPARAPEAMNDVLEQLAALMPPKYRHADAAT